MRAADVMTRGVVSIAATATIYQAAELLVNTRVSGLPVLDELGNMIGIVSEADLIGRGEIGAAGGDGPLRQIDDKVAAAAAYVKSHSRRVGEVMTRDVLACSESTSVSEIAALMLKHRVKRIPVVRDGKPVGMVSRINLVQALITQAASPPPVATGGSGDATPPSDAELKRGVEVAVKAHRWASARTEVTVNGGVVHLWGVVADPAVQQAYRVAAESIPGVKSVMDHMHVVPPRSSRRRSIW